MGKTQGWRLAVSVALLVLAYPPVGLGWLAYVALVPAFTWLQVAPSLRTVVWGSGVLAGGWATGLLYFTLGIYGAGWPERLGAYLAVVAVFALQTALALSFTWRQVRGLRPNWQNRVRFALLVPLWWLGTEWLTGYLTGGLSAHLGLTQWRYPALVRMAGWVGLHGVSGLVVAGNVCCFLFCAACAQGWRQRRRIGSSTQAALLLAAAAALVAAVGAYGGALRATGVWPTAATAVAEQASSVRLVLVQNAFTMQEYEEADRSPVYLSNLFSRLLDQSRAGVALSRAGSPTTAPTLVVWPETVLHEPLWNYPAYAATMQAFTRDTGTWLLAGLPWTNNISFWNAAVLIGPDGQEWGRYAKTRPIPVAEAWVTPGSGWQPLRIGEVAVGVGLCSELIDPVPARALTSNGAALLVFMSSLDYLGSSSAPGLQAAFAPFRAAETGRYVALAGSVGLTLVAAPDGTLRHVLPSRRAGTLVADVPASAGTTLYMQGGYAMPLVALLLCTAVHAMVVRRS